MRPPLLFVPYAFDTPAARAKVWAALYYSRTQGRLGPEGPVILLQEATDAELWAWAEEASKAAVEEGAKLRALDTLEMAHAVRCKGHPCVGQRIQALAERISRREKEEEER